MATKSTRRSSRLAETAVRDEDLEEFLANSLNVKVEVDDITDFPMPSLDLGSPVTIKQEPTSEDDDVEVKVEKNGSDTSRNSLDILASVARGQMVNGPTSPPVKMQRQKSSGNATTISAAAAKLMKKTTGAKRTIALEELWDLSDRQLIEMFTELTSNELTKNFAYTCYLMPENCAAICTSFGNETKAKHEMVFHLLEHLQALLKQAKEDKNFVFTAQTVQCRRKYGSGIDKMQRKRRSKDGATPVGKKANITGDALLLSTNGDSSMTEAAEDGIQVLVPVVRRGRKPKYLVAQQQQQQMLQQQQQKLASSKTQSSNLDVISPLSIKIEPIDYVEKTEIGTDVGGEDRWSPPTLPSGSSGNEKNQAEIAGACHHRQPYVDHAYFVLCGRYEKRDDHSWGEAIADAGTSRTSGWKYGVGEDVDDDDKQTLSVMIRIQTGRTPVPNKLYIPIVRVTRAGFGAMEDGVGAAINGNGVAAADACSLSDVDDDSEDDNEEEDEDNIVNRAVRPRKRFDSGDPAIETERKLALKYIRELRCKKKDDVSLVCKICRTKAFTATATLMYHYRSHAGIKPFVCLICNTTFTRQHSLNYHMLIHNNQNRFTCKDCGRMFRHPSHFKEHLRRHTGETPFLCTDCPLRFKTRNTYKRHLRTRHGKILQSNGIHVMSREEFLRVRTKPYLLDRNRDENDKISVSDEAAEAATEAVPPPPGETISRRETVAVRPFPEITTSRKPAILSHSSSANRIAISGASAAYRS